MLRRKPPCWCRLMLALFVLTTGQSALSVDAEPQGDASWRLQFFNDEVVGTDNQFTSGLSFQRYSRRFTRLEATEGTLAFGKILARRVLPDGSDLDYREGWTLGHNMQTPDDIIERGVILEDVPFVGMLGWGNSYTAFNDRRFTGFGLLLGWAGSATLAEQLQSAAHAVTGARDPKGWDNQLDNEPLVNFYYMKKHKFFLREHLDVAVNVDAALGTFFTFGQASLEARLGKKPGGFAFVPTPVGRGLDYDARIREPGGRYRYLSLVLRATRFLHALPRYGNVLRSGNEWTDNNTISAEKLVGQAIVGLHWERSSWGAHFHLWLSTDTVESGTVREDVDRPNTFGAFTLERRF